MERRSSLALRSVCMMVPAVCRFETRGWNNLRYNDTGIVLVHWDASSRLLFLQCHSPLPRPTPSHHLLRQLSLRDHTRIRCQTMFPTMFPRYPHLSILLKISKQTSKQLVVLPRSSSRRRHHSEKPC